MSEWGPRLDNERGFGVDAGFGTVVFDAVFPVVAEVIEAEAVGFEVGDLEEVVFKEDPLVVGEVAFEDGVLDALAVVEAGSGDLAKAFLSRGGCCADVVADEDEHVFV